MQLRSQAPCATALLKLPCSASHSLWAMGFQCVGSPSCLLALWPPWQTFPFFGVVPAILNESGEELEGEAEGYLVRKGRSAPPPLVLPCELRVGCAVLTQVCVSHRQVFKQPWPGIMRTLYRNHQHFETTYFKKFPGYYVTGDGKVGQEHWDSQAWGQQLSSWCVLASEPLTGGSEGLALLPHTVLSGYF